MKKLDELLNDYVDSILGEEPLSIRVWISNIDEARLFQTLRADTDFCTRLALREHMSDNTITNGQFPSGRIDELYGFEAVGYLIRAIEVKPDRAKVLKEFQW